MERCGTCKHFKRDPPDKYFNHRLGKDFGTCNRIGQFDSHESTPSEEIAGTVDGSDYFSAILCTKDFGCVLHATT